MELFKGRESKNHRRVWVGKDLKNLPVPTSLLGAGTPFTRPGSSRLHPALSTSRMGHPQLLLSRREGWGGFTRLGYLFPACEKESILKMY